MGELRVGDYTTSLRLPTGLVLPNLVTSGEIHWLKPCYGVTIGIVDVSCDGLCASEEVMVVKGKEREKNEGERKE